MTDRRQELKERLLREFEICDKHIVRIEGALKGLKERLPLDEKTYLNLDSEAVMCLDQFIFRFSKLQDTIGAKIFQMEVTMADSSKEDTQAEVSTDISYKSWFGLKVDVQGKVSTSRENTRSTNQTAKYQVSVNARQQPPTEGMSKLMDILASCVEPIDAGGVSN